jgi:hypothetical protein
LTFLFEPEFEFEVVEPRHAGIDTFFLEPLRKVFKMDFPTVGVGRVVIGDEDGVVIDPQITLHTAEQIFGQMERVPLAKGRTHTLAELMDEGLGDQGQAHLPGANVQVERARPLPTEVLLEAERLFHVPAFWKIGGQGGHFRPRPGSTEALEMVGVGAFARGLDITATRFAQNGAPGQELFAGRGKTGPMAGERALRQGSVGALPFGGLSSMVPTKQGQAFLSVMFLFRRRINRSEPHPL